MKQHNSKPVHSFKADRSPFPKSGILFLELYSDNLPSLLQLDPNPPILLKGGKVKKFSIVKKKGNGLFLLVTLAYVQTYILH